MAEYHRQPSSQAAASTWCVLFIVFGLLAFAIQDAIIKGLSQTYPVLQLLTIRSAIVMFLLLILTISIGGIDLLKTRRLPVLMSRGVFAFFAFTLYYLALSKLPLAEGAAVYMTAPLFVTALSVPLLGEKVGIHRTVAVIAGFIAALMMINPGSAIFQVAAMLPLISAMLYSFIPIINRHIGRREHPLTMAVYTMLSYLLLSLVASLLVHVIRLDVNSQSVLSGLLDIWPPMDFSDVLAIFCSGALFVLGLLGLTQSYRLLPVSIVAPFEYSYLIWATVIGYVAFNEIPSLRTLIGGIVIVGCGCYIAFRDNRSPV